MTKLLALFYLVLSTTAPLALARALPNPHGIVPTATITTSHRTSSHHHHATGSHSPTMALDDVPEKLRDGILSHASEYWHTHKHDRRTHVPTATYTHIYEGGHSGMPDWPSTPTGSNGGGSWNGDGNGNGHENADADGHGHGHGDSGEHGTHPSGGETGPAGSAVMHNMTHDGQDDHTHTHNDGHADPQHRRRHLHSRSHSHSHSHLHTRGIAKRDGVSQLLAIAPTADTCIGASFPAECTTATPAVVMAILDSFAKHNISTAAEQAALLSWMAFESGEFKYNANHFPAPGRPGQGTRVMLMPEFVREYAASLPELKSNTLTTTDPDKVLAWVQGDGPSFGAAAWYYDTHCTPTQKEQVRHGGRPGWQAGFVEGCVHTTLTDERTAYWTRAARKLGLVD